MLPEECASTLIGTHEVWDCTVVGRYSSVVQRACLLSTPLLLFRQVTALVALRECCPKPYAGKVGEKYDAL